MNPIKWLINRFFGLEKHPVLSEERVSTNLQKTISGAIFAEPDESMRAYDAAENVDDFIRFLK